MQMAALIRRAQRFSRFRFMLSAVALTAIVGAAPFPSIGLAGDDEKVESKYQIKDLDGHFPFKVPENKEAWTARAEVVKRQLVLSQGIMPMPTMAPIKSTIHSPRDMDGYRIEKVYFESLPGLYVTGSLYTPTTKRADKMPGVLCPHGHWDNGRFYWANDGEVRKLIASGAEQFESAAHNHLQARCVQLARMGCVVFHYDMIGYADSQQISFDRAHRFGINISNPPVADGQWLLYSPQAEGHLQSVMGLQTINSLQAFEFLRQRSDVDPDRIAITGASGGGTQSFIAAAVEPRLAGAFPAVMVSTGMQGGCTCENASCARVDTGNVEIAALIAPRPLGMTAADDWTRTMEKDGFPELKKLYGFYKAADRVELFPALQFPHNYNQVARVAMYGFMNRLFQLGYDEPIAERDFEVLKREDLTVWDAEHPAPPQGPEFEAELLNRWTADTQAQLTSHPEQVTEGWRTLLEPANRIAKTLRVGRPRLNDNKMVIEIRNLDNKIVGALSLGSISNAAGGVKSVFVGSDVSKAKTGPGAWRLETNDAWGIDAGTEQSLVKNPRPAAAYTYGYNAPLIVRKLAVLLCVVDTMPVTNAATIEFSGNGTGSFLIAGAKLLRSKQVVKATIVGDSIDFGAVDSIRHVDFLPGALRYGGMTGLTTAAGMELPKTK